MSVAVGVIRDCGTVRGHFGELGPRQVVRVFLLYQSGSDKNSKRPASCLKIGKRGGIDAAVGVVKCDGNDLLVSLLRPA